MTDHQINTAETQFAYFGNAPDFQLRPSSDEVTVRAAVASVSETEQRFLLLRFAYLFPIPEIAQMFNCGEDQAEHFLEQALLNFNRALERITLAWALSNSARLFSTDPSAASMFGPAAQNCAYNFRQQEAKAPSAFEEACRLLGTRTSDPVEVHQKAYRAKLKKNHPDMVFQSTLRKKANAAERTKRVIQAYAVIAATLQSAAAVN